MSERREFRIPATLARETPARTCVDAEVFALQVTDQSMEPELPKGCVVVIDPGLAPRDGDLVVAQPGADSGISIGRLALADPQAWLLMDRPATRLALPHGKSDVLGVVVQRVNGGRSSRKRYR